MQITTMNIAQSDTIAWRIAQTSLTGVFMPLLSSQVAKQWYDYERSSYNFVRLLRGNNKITFTHMQDFDENGLLYWLGTNGKSMPDWVNPGSVGIVAISTSESRGLPYGKIEDILSRETAALNCHTNDDK